MVNPPTSPNAWSTDKKFEKDSFFFSKFTQQMKIILFNILFHNNLFPNIYV